MPDTVTLNGTLYEKANFAGRGYLTYLFPMLQDLVEELAAADTVNGVAPGGAGGQLQTDGASWLRLGYLRLATSAIAPATDQNNLAPGDYAVLRVTPTANISITGLTSGVDGRLLTIENWSAYTITLPDESASSTAANRLNNPDGTPVELTGGRSITYRYDATASRWNLYSWGGLGGTPDFDGGTAASPNAATLDGGTP